MKHHARAVVIGGGISGCCILYHLAKSEQTDVVLLEKRELTSEATCQAAGMLIQFSTSPTMMHMSKYSVEMQGDLEAYKKVGSLRIASSRQQFKTLQHKVIQARGLGLEVEIVSPKEAMGLIPWMSDKNLYCGIYLPDDGHLDPHGATLAVAKAATSLGAAVFTNTRVKGIQLSRKGEIAQAIFVRSEISKSSKQSRLWRDGFAIQDRTNLT